MAVYRFTWFIGYLPSLNLGIFVRPSLTNNPDYSQTAFNNASRSLIIPQPIFRTPWLLRAKRPLSEPFNILTIYNVITLRNENTVENN
jgi:hypothetical protein